MNFTAELGNRSHQYRLHTDPFIFRERVCNIHRSETYLYNHRSINKVVKNANFPPFSPLNSQIFATLAAARKLHRIPAISSKIGKSRARANYTRPRNEAVNSLQRLSRFATSSLYSYEKNAHNNARLVFGGRARERSTSREITTLV